MASRDRSYPYLAGLSCVVYLLVLGACEESLKLPSRRLGSALGDGGKPELVQNGDPCSADEQCASAHCNHELCCDSGECCQQAEDCPTIDGMGAVCDMSTCQGTRGVASCSDDFRCEVNDGVEDDSACARDMVASTCGLYASVSCNGKTEQSKPKCLTECSDEEDCDQDAHCQDGACMPDLAEGASCAANGDCSSDHCDNGLCCASGTCCNSVEDCIAADPSSTVASCDTAAMCQGTRPVPACEAHQCTTKKINDDSACDRTIIANDCNGGPPVKCSGDRDQRTPPPCAGVPCSQDFGCARTAFCMRGTCTPDYSNGDTCTSPDMCQSGHCENDVCCSYDCCDMQNRCPGAPCAEETECQ